jgi:phosphoribosyl 1,2-cyclic phosphodiesterase
MKIRFWGTRGSIPVALTADAIRHKLTAALTGAAGCDLSSPAAVAAYVDGLDFSIRGTYGGHSSCVEACGDDDSHVIFDLGSGARPLAQSLLARHGGSGRTYHVLMSHLHWDHIMGFPFFVPAYLPGNRIVIHGCHAELETAFRRQQDAPSFPVDFSALAARIEFDVVEPGRPIDIGGFVATAKKQRHGGDSYGWRLEGDGRTVVYSTDSEHRVEDDAERAAFVEFFRAADLVVFDAMYSLAEAISVKADWGHSSNIVGVELCQNAGAKRLCLFHHEPAHDDAQIERVLRETRRFEELTRDGPVLEILAAWDGLEVDLGAGEQPAGGA